jgi:L-lactate dehydrogenase complex protein LldE
VLASALQTEPKRGFPVRDTVTTNSADRPQVALFVTCLVDLFRPSVGFASVELLQRAGCDVVVPEGQSCCGQPGYNAGDLAASRTVARQFIATFEGYQYVVAPSGSCAAMVKHHYPSLLADEPEWRRRAEALADHCYELSSFLVDVMQVDAAELTRQSAPLSVSYHDSCAGLRELGIKQQPRTLLAGMADVELTEMQDTHICCGFGGTFCVKLPDISREMVDAKIANAEASGAQLLLGGDMGCLLNIAGRISREGKTLEVRHFAEVLAGEIDDAAIGRGDKT